MDEGKPLIPHVSGSIQSSSPARRSRRPSCKAVVVLVLVVTVIVVSILFRSDITRAFSVCPSGSTGCPCSHEGNRDIGSCADEATAQATSAAVPHTGVACAVAVDHGASQGQHDGSGEGDGSTDQFCAAGPATKGSTPGMLGYECAVDKAGKTSCTDTSAFAVWLPTVGVNHTVCYCVSRPGAIQHLVDKAGPWAPVVYGGVYVAATVFMLPASLLTVAAGVVFSLPVAFATVWVAANIGATIALFLGRLAFRDTVIRAAASYPKFGAIDTAVARQHWLVFLLRLSPAIPFNILNYALGVTGVPASKAIPYSAVGMAPGTFLFVYIGWATRSAVSSATSGGKTDVAKDVLLYGVGLAATLGAVVAVTIIARRAVNKIIAEEKAAAEAVEDGEASSQRGTASTLLDAPRAGSASFPGDVRSVRDELRTVLDKPVADTALFKDLPRLYARATVYNREGVCTFDSDAKAGTLTQFVTAVAALVEEDESTVRSLASSLHTALNEPNETTVGALQRVLTEPSYRRTLVGLRPIHQGVLMPVTKWLKLKTRFNTKDVSGPLGWRIRVSQEDVRPPVLRVQHVRREQSMAVAPSADDYWIEYSIAIDMDVACDQPEHIHVSFPDYESQSDLVSAEFAVLHDWNSTASRER
mmetsp:Transcript_1963/g.6206  ORF Transcript_1963/g.6206 Transcript_1963/m.6206 type:complete len:643 (-) Transcript_1963:124-2052(-)|eukprot:CAMPEP_0170748046 /NCGR_PEP_ID=MMETSP0437-20130122/9642_1 /TAXON_ID=0 /ORGANISM="Sexangularia sp." /LENGTH=642 /DNA_ID=CAMNT_0011086855 /DNA_START=53 /DNA_END=1981 /DNA_ORIENTATION=+